MPGKKVRRIERRNTSGHNSKRTLLLSCRGSRLLALGGFSAGSSEIKTDRMLRHFDVLSCLNWGTKLWLYYQYSRILEQFKGIKDIKLSIFALKYMLPFRSHADQQRNNSLPDEEF